MIDIIVNYVREMLVKMFEEDKAVLRHGNTCILQRSEKEELCVKYYQFQRY